MSMSPAKVAFFPISTAIRLLAFIDCVLSREEPIAPVEAGAQASYLGMVAEISIRLGRTLRWDPTAERFIDDAQANGLLSAPMRSPCHL